MSWSYKEKTEKQLRDWYNDKIKKKQCAFQNFSDFLEWYNSSIKNKSCYYCGISEQQSQEIVHNGLLESKRFPKNGEFKQGVNRGYWLEIDKRNPTGLYSKENCVPSCYFCNNDKSDVFTDIQYKSFIMNRTKFLKELLNNEAIK